MGGEIEAAAGIATVDTTAPKDQEERGQKELGEKEKLAVKDRYLGAIKKKKRARKLNDRKFVFDWDAGGGHVPRLQPVVQQRSARQPVFWPLAAWAASTSRRRRRTRAPLPWSWWRRGVRS